MYLFKVHENETFVVTVLSHHDQRLSVVQRSAVQSAGAIEDLVQMGHVLIESDWVDAFVNPEAQGLLAELVGKVCHDEQVPSTNCIAFDGLTYLLGYSLALHVQLQRAGVDDQEERLRNWMLVLMAEYNAWNPMTIL